jgi:predicted ArsR family transcriptional regulator
LHENTVREHLEGLLVVRLARRERVPAAGRGRPAWRYVARRGQESTAVRDHVGLATALAGQIARSSADPAGDAEAAGRDWGRALVADLPVEPTPAAARRRVIRLLDDAGFAPLADPRHRTVRLERCPLLDVARQYPEVVCGVHAGMVRAALTGLTGPTEPTAPTGPGAMDDAAGVRLLPFARPGACLLHLGPGRARPGERERIV